MLCPCRFQAPRAVPLRARFVLFRWSMEGSPHLPLAHRAPSRDIRTPGFAADAFISSSLPTNRPRLRGIGHLGQGLKAPKQ